MLSRTYQYVLLTSCYTSTWHHVLFTCWPLYTISCLDSSHLIQCHTYIYPSDIMSLLTFYPSDTMSCLHYIYLTTCPAYILTIWTRCPPYILCIWQNVLLTFYPSDTMSCLHSVQFFFWHHVLLTFIHLTPGPAIKNSYQPPRSVILLSANHHVNVLITMSTC